MPMHVLVYNGPISRTIYLVSVALMGLGWYWFIFCVFRQTSIGASETQLHPEPPPAAESLYCEERFEDVPFERWSYVHYMVIIIATLLIAISTTVFCPLLAHSCRVLRGGHY